MSTKHFFIRCDGKYIRIDIKDICYIEALKNYVRIFTEGGAYLALISMRQIEEELPANEFCRIHRSFIVPLARVKSFDNEMLYLEKVSLPVSPAYKNILQGKVRILFSDTRAGEKRTVSETVVGS
jgi:DNA-binding LytR/AlgR family response regulator